MKKSELNPYMLLETRCGEKMRFIKGYFITNELEILDQDTYTEDLIYAYNNERHDIVKVYEEDSETVKWEKNEIDWNDVPIGTKVYMVPDTSENTPIYYFLKYNPKNKYPFKVFGDDGELHECKFCKLAEEPVTVKEINEEFDKYCNSRSCENCKYNLDDGYCYGWVLDNYNVIRK